MNSSNTHPLPSGAATARRVRNRRWRQRVVKTTNMTDRCFLSHLGMKDFDAGVKCDSALCRAALPNLVKIEAHSFMPLPFDHSALSEATPQAYAASHCLPATQRVLRPPPNRPSHTTPSRQRVDSSAYVRRR
ncbi:hypothetical protein [Caballeronia sp. J97]|uniref:hypothetical protein n=1 Tax=Caballeronia sp. J97 TaxID=2805429 RepID=UPI0039EE8A23